MMIYDSGRDEKQRLQAAAAGGGGGGGDIGGNLPTLKLNRIVTLRDTWGARQ